MFHHIIDGNKLFYGVRPSQIAGDVLYHRAVLRDGVVMRDGVVHHNGVTLNADNDRLACAMVVDADTRKQDQCHKGAIQ